MRREKFWISLALLNLSIVAFVGMILRSKILFSLPFIDYNRLLDAHEHFAFGAWVTLALMTLLIYELLPDARSNKPIYQWLLTGVAINSWFMLFTYTAGGNSFLSDLFSTFFILVSYIFSWVFISDLLKSKLSRTVVLLVIAGVICLVASSAGSFSLAYLFAAKSLNVIFYKDALYTFLHFQYNGFFTLSVFALLFHKLESKLSPAALKNIYRFSLLLVISILPSQFLSYLWQGPNKLFLILAVAGSISLVLCLISFIITLPAISKVEHNLSPVVRYLGIFSMCAFMLKVFLQSFTIFPSVGNAVFGDRPVIIGFLHLVFLGFVTTFLLAYFAQRNFLDIRNKFTRNALIIFTLGILINEGILMTQGLGTMFIIGSHIYPWLLWIASIWLFSGAGLIIIARFMNRMRL